MSACTSDPDSDETTTPPDADSGGSEAEPADPSSSSGGAAPDESSSGGAESSSGGAQGSSDGADSSGGADGGVQVSDEWIARIEGTWVGPVDPTPIGAIKGFPLDFTWQGDGSLHAFSGDDTAAFDFRFRKQDREWVFDEEGQFKGLTQNQTLHATAIEGDTVTFEVVEMPGYLAVDITVDDERFVMDVAVFGREHAAFDLARQ